MDLPARAREAEAVRQIPAHVLPKSLPLLIRNDARFIVVAFQLLIVSGNVLPVRARTTAAAASTAASVELYERQMNQLDCRINKQTIWPTRTFLPPRLPIASVFLLEHAVKVVFKKNKPDRAVS